MNKFGTRIKVLRLTNGLTQGDLAAKLGVATAFNWENGKLPRPSIIPRLARILGVEASELAELWMEESLAKNKGILKKEGG